MDQHSGDYRAAYERRTEQFKRLLTQAKGLTDNLRRNFEGMVQLLTDVLTQAAPDLGAHAKRTAALARSTAFAMRLNPDRRRLTFYAASLHDLSLIGHSEEWQKGEGEAWRAHPMRTAEMIATVENLKRLAETVVCHHESFDGSGFPKGLKGQEIPLESRIIAACSAYDRRLILNGLETGEAFDGIDGSPRFDPEVCRTLGEIIRGNRDLRNRGDRLLAMEQLCPGMLLADDLLLANGLILFPRETMIDEESLERIRSFRRMLPADRMIRVYQQR